MKIAFYFDPSCPWCWVTSRWILMSSNKRDIDIDWRLFSLAYKNGELEGKQSYANHLPANRVERVMLAAAKKGAKLNELYTNFGIKHFLSDEEYSDEVIASVLKQCKLDKDLIKAADDKSLDKELITSSKSALKIVGQDIGVPTIVFIDEDGKQTGFFGPVLKELPDQDESVKLWDSLVELAKYDGFYELKRGRDGGPDVYSAAKC
jgi:predicted DsbA family dithiol-disulfide isomerase